MAETPRFQLVFEFANQTNAGSFRTALTNDLKTIQTYSGAPVTMQDLGVWSVTADIALVNQADLDMLYTKYRSQAFTGLTRGVLCKHLCSHARGEQPKDYPYNCRDDPRSQRTVAAR